MDMQGFPLYAVDPEYPDAVYVVIGWLHGRMPKLVPLTHGARGGQATLQPGEDRTYRFTTTDPREQPERTEGTNMAARFVDMIRRMRALADVLESHGEHDAARGIRQELDK